MARLIAPNGVEVEASELDAPILLAAGYRPADKKAEAPSKPARKRATRQVKKDA